MIYDSRLELLIKIYFLSFDTKLKHETVSLVFILRRNDHKTKCVDYQKFSQISYSMNDLVAKYMKILTKFKFMQFLSNYLQ